MADPAVVRIFDTTLRDGEQSPGAAMTFAEKLKVAERLVRLNVDIIYSRSTSVRAKYSTQPPVNSWVTWSFDSRWLR